MFQITDRAAQALKAALSKSDVPESACFRIGVSNNKVKFSVDEERPGDATVKHKGELLVVLDPAAGNLLYDRILDFGDKTPGLVLKEAEKEA